MPFFIIAGLPRASGKRLRLELGKRAESPWPHWEMHDFASDSQRFVALQDSSLARMVSLAQEKDGHVYSFRPQQASDRERILQRLTPFFRFGWLPNEWLGYYPHRVGDFIDRLAEFLSVEETWVKDVQPTGARSPLLLPRDIFQAAGDHKLLWDKAAVTRDLARVQDAARALNSFKETHWLSLDSGKRVWVDAADRVFDSSGPRHGRTPIERGWKYSFRIPDGLHFDVTARSGRHFYFQDARGSVRSVGAGAHLNIDSFGFVRGD